MITNDEKLRLVQEIRAALAEDNTADIGFEVAPEVAEFIADAVENTVLVKPKAVNEKHNYACTACGIWFTYKWNHCPYCGQAIDWSEDE